MQAVVEEGKATLYVEVPARMKASLEELARRHNRKLTGEVKQAFQEYLTKFGMWAAEADARGCDD